MRTHPRGGVEHGVLKKKRWERWEDGGEKHENLGLEEKKRCGWGPESHEGSPGSKGRGGKSDCQASVGGQ